MSDVTDCDKRLLNLDERQLRALDVLCAGGTHQEAADAAGVDRVTVSRWNTRHPGFVAERNFRRMEHAQASRARLLNGIGAAADLLAARVDEGDVSAAIALLRWAGPGVLLGSINPGPVEAQAVYEEMLESEARSRFRDPLLSSLADLSGETEARSRARDEARAALLAASGATSG
jgi:hypothetical protein